jgi:phospholipid-binding lipoprotein MlaA
MLLMKILEFKSPLVRTSFIGLLAVTTLTAQGSNLAEDEAFFCEEVDESAGVYDPFESVNRFTFKFNDFVFSNTLQPLVETYTAITPDPVEEGASNFFHNLRYPVRLASNLLQWRFKSAWVETSRFAINSTVGIVGFLTPADDYDGLGPIKSEDVGQAFGAWGIGEGPYLVLPLLGPSNLRDLAGFFGDRAVNPLKEPFAAIDDWKWEWQLTLSGSRYIARGPAIIERYKQLKGSSIDPYSSLRNGYVQYRRGVVAE